MATAAELKAERIAAAEEARMVKQLAPAPTATQRAQTAMVAQVVAAAIVNSPAVLNAPKGSVPSVQAVQEVAKAIAAAVAPTIATALSPEAIQSIVKATSTAVIANPQVAAADIGKTVAPDVIQKIADSVVKTSEVTNALSASTIAATSQEGARYQAQAPNTPAVPKSNFTYGANSVPDYVPPTDEQKLEQLKKLEEESAAALAAAKKAAAEAAALGAAGDKAAADAKKSQDEIAAADKAAADAKAAADKAAADAKAAADKAAADARVTADAGSTAATKTAADLQAEIDSKAAASKLAYDTADADKTNAIKLGRTSAFETLKAEFTKYGLGSLVDDVQNLILNGTPISEATLKLRATPQYQLRFAGNKARLAAGKNLYDESTYLALENDFQSSFEAYGQKALLGKTRESAQAMFAEYIGSDKSPDEIKNRIRLAVDEVGNRKDIRA
jgi:hypothetical protein